MSSSTPSTAFAPSRLTGRLRRSGGRAVLALPSGFPDPLPSVPTATASVFISGTVSLEAGTSKGCRWTGAHNVFAQANRLIVFVVLPFAASERLTVFAVWTMISNVRLHLFDSARTQTVIVKQKRSFLFSL